MAKVARLTQIHRFWTKYRPDPKDPSKMIGEDWVEFGPPGMGDRTRTTEKVSRLLAVRPRDQNSMNRALNEANDLAEFIGPEYEAWKNGQDLPETGTPLAAWNAITPEAAEILKARSIRTVEEIAELTESGMQRVPMPGIRRLVEQAKLFLAAQDQNRVAADLSRKDDEIAALKAQMDEMLSMLAAREPEAVTEDEVEEAPKRRGRPPKAVVEAVA